MKKGDKFTFVGTVEVFNVSSAQDDKGRLPFVITPISGDSPRHLNIVSAEVMMNQKKDFYLDRAVKFEVTYQGLFKSEYGKEIESFSFRVLHTLYKKGLEKARQEKLNILIPPPKV